MTYEDVKDSLSTALAYCANKLTAEKLDYCERKRSNAALRYRPYKLTPKQFDSRVRENPWVAINFWADKLTEEQKQYCEDKSK